MSDLRSAAALRAVGPPAWPALEALVRAADGATVLPAPAARRDAELERLQVTTRSPLGAVVAETGAIRVDHGWLHLLGAGTDALPSPTAASPERGAAPPPWLVVAFDVLGGRFAINGGGLDAELGEVCHFAVDTLEWTGLGSGHGAFVEYVLTGGLADLHASLRWPGWEDEVDGVAEGSGLAVFPFPFTAEGADLAATSRRAVPIAELHGVYEDFAEQLSMLPGAGTVDDTSGG